MTWLRDGRYEDRTIGVTVAGVGDVAPQLAGRRLIRFVTVELISTKEAHLDCNFRKMVGEIEQQMTHKGMPHQSALLPVSSIG